MNAKAKNIVKTLRGCVFNIGSACDKCAATGELTCGCRAELMLIAADLIEQLQQELVDERYRHDRLQDFCVAQGEELSKLKEQQRWIPVTERLPENGITVLTLDKRGHMRDRALHTFRGGQRLFRPDGLAPGYDILYWRSLPEPPKEAQNDPDKAL